MSKNQVKKECRGCGNTLPLDNFGKNKGSKDGQLLIKQFKMRKINLFPTIVTALFVALKLTSVIDWSWLWVFSPIPISFVIGFTNGFIRGLVRRLES